MRRSTKHSFMQAIPLSNLLRYTLDLYIRPSRALAKPSYLQISTTSRCNLACKMCNNQRLRRRASLPLEDFVTILQHAREVPIIVFSGIGENFLHRDFLDMVDLCRQEGKYIQVTTNLNVGKHRLEKLLTYRIDLIDVSIDGWDQASYEQIRIHGKWSLLIENLQAMSQFIREESLPTRIRVRLVLSRYNADRLIDFVTLMERLGVHAIEISPLTGAVHKEVRAVSSYTTIVKALRRRLKQSSVILEAQKVSNVKAINRCPYPYRGMYIAETGAYLPCCWQLHNPRYEQIVHEEFPFGSLKDYTPDMAWNSPPMRHFRRMMRLGKTPDFCRGCVLFKGAA
ncbi:MAG: radical SAM protein [Nitrospinota bacterium]|nr:MAG: radical SAM protein [Nitrospinota bacterium]